MKRYLVLGLIAVLFVSGCVSQGDTITTGGGDGTGLEIVDFSADRDEVYSEQTVHAVMEIENQGQADVDQKDGMALLITTADWDVVSASGTSEELHKKVKLDKDFDQANPVTGKPGDLATIRWTLKAPDVEKGKDRSDKIFGRLYYDYNTVSEGQIWIYPDTERDDDTITSSDTFVSSTGPLDIDVSVIPDPAIAEYSGEIITLQILITNIGDGTPYSPDIVSYEKDYDINETDRNNVHISYSTDSVDLKPIDNACPEEVELVDDSAVVMCDLNTTKKFSAKQSYPVTITTQYGYVVEEEINIDIIGK